MNNVDSVLLTCEGIKMRAIRKTAKKLSLKTASFLELGEKQLCAICLYATYFCMKPHHFLISSSVHFALSSTKSAVPISRWTLTEKYVGTR